MGEGPCHGIAGLAAGEKLGGGTTDVSPARVTLQLTATEAHVPARSDTGRVQQEIDQWLDL